MDLGEHRLRDLAAPAALAARHRRSANEFPALRTLENRPTNLPPSSPRFGREREVTDVVERLGARSRLLTLTGPGGTGKTRLGLQAAAELVDDFPRGRVLRRAGADRRSRARAADDRAGTRAEGERAVPLARAWVTSLREAAPASPRQLRAGRRGGTGARRAAAEAPQLKLLVTSRIPVHVSGEHEYPVPPLDLPDPAHLPEVPALSQYEAVALFVARARAVNPASPSATRMRLR